jgi:hypothetical protein
MRMCSSKPDSTSGNRGSYGIAHAHKRGHLPMSSSFSSPSPSTTAPAATASESGQSSTNLLGNMSSSIGALRHEDAGAAPSLLARSGSGRLPPAYDPVWQATRGESSRRNTNPDSEYQEGSPSYMSDREPSVQRSKR